MLPNGLQLGVERNSQLLWFWQLEVESKPNFVLGTCYMYLLWDLIGSLGNLCLLCLARVVSLGNYFGCYIGSDELWKVILESHGLE